MKAVQKKVAKKSPKKSRKSSGTGAGAFGKDIVKTAIQGGTAIGGAIGASWALAKAKNEKIREFGHLGIAAAGFTGAKMLKRIDHKIISFGVGCIGGYGFAQEKLKVKTLGAGEFEDYNPEIDDDPIAFAEDVEATLLGAGVAPEKVEIIVDDLVNGDAYQATVGASVPVEMTDTVNAGVMQGMAYQTHGMYQ